MNFETRVMLEQAVDTLLCDHRYHSISGRGMRGLMPHHIAALKADLVPFIQRLLDVQAAEIEELTEELDGALENAEFWNSISF